MDGLGEQRRAHPRRFCDRELLLEALLNGVKRLGVRGISIPADIASPSPLTVAFAGRRRPPSEYRIVVETAGATLASTGTAR